MALKAVRDSLQFQIDGLCSMTSSVKVRQHCALNLFEMSSRADNCVVLKALRLSEPLLNLLRVLTSNNRNELVTRAKENDVVVRLLLVMIAWTVFRDTSNNQEPQNHYSSLFVEVVPNLLSSCVRTIPVTGDASEETASDAVSCTTSLNSRSLNLNFSKLHRKRKFASSSNVRNSMSGRRISSATIIGSDSTFLEGSGAATLHEPNESIGSDVNLDIPRRVLECLARDWPTLLHAVGCFEAVSAAQSQNCFELQQWQTLLASLERGLALALVGCIATSTVINGVQARLVLPRFDNQQIQRSYVCKRPRLKRPYSNTAPAAGESPSCCTNSSDDQEIVTDCLPRCQAKLRLPSPITATEISNSSALPDSVTYLEALSTAAINSINTLTTRCANFGVDVNVCSISGLDEVGVDIWVSSHMASTYHYLTLLDVACYRCPENQVILHQTSTLVDVLIQFVAALVPTLDCKLQSFLFLLHGFDMPRLMRDTINAKSTHVQTAITKVATLSPVPLISPTLPHAIRFSTEGNLYTQESESKFDMNGKTSINQRWIQALFSDLPFQHSNDRGLKAGPGPAELWLCSLRLLVNLMHHAPTTSIALCSVPPTSSHSNPVVIYLGATLRHFHDWRVKFASASLPSSAVTKASTTIVTPEETISVPGNLPGPLAPPFSPDKCSVTSSEAIQFTSIPSRARAPLLSPDEELLERLVFDSVLLLTVLLNNITESLRECETAGTIEVDCADAPITTSVYHRSMLNLRNISCLQANRIGEATDTITLADIALHILLTESSGFVDTLQDTDAQLHQLSLEDMTSAGLMTAVTVGGESGDTTGGLIRPRPCNTTGESIWLGSGHSTGESMERESYATTGKSMRRESCNMTKESMREECDDTTIESIWRKASAGIASVQINNSECSRTEFKVDSESPLAQLNKTEVTPSRTPAAETLPIAELILSAHASLLLYSLHRLLPRQHLSHSQSPNHSPKLPRHLESDLGQDRLRSLTPPSTPRARLFSALPRHSWWLPIRTLKAYLSLQGHAGVLLQESALQLCSAIHTLEAEDAQAYAETQAALVEANPLRRTQITTGESETFQPGTDSESDEDDWVTSACTPRFKLKTQLLTKPAVSTAFASTRSTPTSRCTTATREALRVENMVTGDLPMERPILFDWLWTGSQLVRKQTEHEMEQQPLVEIMQVPKCDKASSYSTNAVLDRLYIDAESSGTTIANDASISRIGEKIISSVSIGSATGGYFASSIMELNESSIDPPCKPQFKTTQRNSESPLNITRVNSIYLAGGNVTNSSVHGIVVSNHASVLPTLPASHVTMLLTQSFPRPAHSVPVTQPLPVTVRTYGRRPQSYPSDDNWLHDGRDSVSAGAYISTANSVTTLDTSSGQNPGHLTPLELGQSNVSLVTVNFNR